MAKAVLLVLALALAACAHPIQSDRPEPVVVGPGSESVPYAYRAGSGVVEDVSRIDAAGAAAAGGTVGRVVERAAYRLTVRMDDGTVQTVLQDSPDFAVGDRVRLTEDGRVIRL